MNKKMLDEIKKDMLEMNVVDDILKKSKCLNILENDIVFRYIGYLDYKIKKINQSHEYSDTHFNQASKEALKDTVESMFFLNDSFDLFKKSTEQTEKLMIDTYLTHTQKIFEHSILNVFKLIIDLISNKDFLIEKVKEVISEEEGNQFKKLFDNGIIDKNGDLIP